MAAITETSVGRSDIRLTSTEFPELSIEGGRARSKDLRKKLNQMMREKRRKSGGTLGKSPKFNKNKAPEVTDDIGDVPVDVKSSPVKKKKPKRYQGYKSDIEFIKRNSKNKLSADPKKAVDQSNLKDMIDYESNIPEEPAGGFSQLPHIKRRQQAEAKRKREQRASQMAPQAGPVLSEKSHPLLVSQDRKLAQEEERESRLHAGEFDGIGEEKPWWMPTPRDQSPPKNVPDSREEQIKKIKMMLTRGEIDPNSPEVRRILGNENLPEHLRVEPKTEREKYVEKIKKMIANGEMSPDNPEAKRILGSGDPSPFVGPDKVLEQKEVSPERLAELDAIDQKLKSEAPQGQETATEVATNEDGGLMKKPDAPKAGGGVSEEPIRTDENGYPIYHKDSKMAASFREAHKNAPNNSKFMWNGKEYWKGGNKPEDKKEDEKAAVDVARQDYSTGDANLAESLYTPQEKIEKKIKQIEQISKGDHHPEWSPSKREEEKEKIIEDLDKESTAEIREADPNFYVDPWTGFAIDLNKLQARQDRKDSMEMAALLPANQRATYLMQEDLISKRDLKKLLKPSEMEQLDMQIKKMNLNVMSNSLKLSQQKLQDYRTPEQLLKLQQSGKISDEMRAEAAQIRAEKRNIESGEFGQYIKLYNNAVQNEDYEGQIFFGTQMGFPPAKMQKIATARMNLQLKSTSEKDKDEFKGLFQHELSKVYTDRKSFVFGASSVFEEGMMQVEFNGKTYKGRKGLLDAMGLSDWEDLLPAAGGTVQDLDMAKKEIHNMTAGREIFDAPEFQNEDGSPNYDALIDDQKTYKRFLMDNIIYQGMYNIYGSSYNNILEYEDQLHAKQRQALEGMNKKLTQQQG